MARSREGRRAAAERRQLEAAEQIFEVLGNMKGAAMKVGQVASFVDTGAFPPEFQERIQRKLAELRDAAPRVPFDQVRELDRATRDRFGEIVFRFFFGSLYRNGHFSGDPHPGNNKLMPDGRVAFLDFGMTKKLDRAHLDAEREAIRAGMERDASGLHAQLASMGFFDAADGQVTPEAVLAHFRDVTGWYIDDREVAIDKRTVQKVLIDFGDPRSKHWELMKRETLPPQAMLARRMEALTLGVLGQLGATANWHRVAREGLFGDPPSTELGAREESFHVRAAA